MSTKAQLEEKINSLSESFEQNRSKRFDPQEHKDKTRSQIAKFVVVAYFILIGIVLIGVPIYNVFVKENLVISMTDILSSLAGIINGTFGFVVGYYFKGSEKD